MAKPPISSGQLDLRITKQDLEPKPYWEVIGQGSFAIVHKAYCNKHNGFVAVKEVSKGDGQQKEIDKLVQLITHIHVVGIKGVYRDNDRNFIIMEYCSYSLSGLRKILEKTYIPWPRCLHFMQQIMSGVEFLHHNNIIHRDIKPENIMVTDSFVCKIADLGLAKHESSHTNSNKDSIIIQPSGSMFYISPERWNSPADPAKESDDIYSCGMVFFKMITNADLFYLENLPWDESVVSNLKYYLKGEWRESFIGQLGDDCPVIVKAVLKSCWHKEPVKRRTCKSWADSLRNYILHEVDGEDLAKADNKLKDLLEGGKSRTRHDISQSPATPLSDRASAGGEERDYRDSPTDDAPPTTDDDPPTTDEDPPITDNDPPTTYEDPPTTLDIEVSSAYPEGLTGRYADGASFHLEEEMSNLTVEAEYTDVFVLSGGNDVIECHGLQVDTSYKLYLKKDAPELCFIKVPIRSDGNEKRIPLRRIQTIVKNKKERILTLQVRVAGGTKVQHVTLSVSSPDTLFADLRACGVCVVEDDDNSVQTDANCRYYRQQTQDSHLQDESTQCCWNSQPFQQNRSPNMQPPPHADQPHSQLQNPSHHGQSQYQPEVNQNRQPTSSQTPTSINYINNVENFYNGPMYYQGGPPNT